MKAIINIRLFCAALDVPIPVVLADKDISFVIIDA
jgi:hypothetical protein